MSSTSRYVRSSLLFVFVFLLTTIFVGKLGGAAPLSPPAPPSHASPAVLSFPPVFVENAGQYDRRVRFVSRGSHHAIFATDDGVTLALAPSPAERVALRLVLVDASARRLEPLQPDAARVHVLTGRDARRWKRNLPAYREIVYRDAWPGIDAAVGVESGTVKYEFRVQPGADPSRIRLRYDGAGHLSLGDDGELRIPLGAGQLIDAAPRTIQHIGQENLDVDSSFVLWPDGQVGFAIGDYDRTQPLVIDPTLVYASYLGSSGWDEGRGVAVDAAGSTYVTGFTQWIDFPVTPGAYQPFLGGQDTNSPKRDAFVTKVNASGALVYSTYVGGTDHDEANGIAVDNAGHAYITGMTRSADFPVTAGAFQSTFAGTSDAFVVKLDPTGSTPVYSTFYGGLAFEIGFGIAVDSSGRAFVTGRTNATATRGVPGTNTGFQPEPVGGSGDGFLIRMSPDGSAVGYGTYLGGSGFDTPSAVAVKGADAFVTGQTDSADFPTTPGAYSRAGIAPAFKTTDGGATWGTVSPLQVQSLTRFAVDPSNPSVVYAGTDGEGVYKSTSGGDTFFFSGTGIAPGSDIRGLAVDRNVTSTVYASSTTGLYKSLDAGATWSLMPIPQGPGSIAIDAGSTVFANGSSGVWRSVDGGFNWQLVLTLTIAQGLAAHPFQPGTIYAAAGSGGLYRTLDNGDHWTPVGAGLPFFITDIAIDPVGSLYVGTLLEGVFKSVDGGASFAKLNVNVSVRNMTFDPATSPPTIYALGGSFDFPVVKSTDGGATFTVLSVRDTIINASAIAVVGPSTVLLGVTSWNDAFVARINTAVAGAASLVYATYLSGTGEDRGNGIAVDAFNQAYVTGSTNSADFPVTEGEVPRTNAFLTKLDTGGASLMFSTYVGETRATDARAVALDDGGNALVAGLVFPASGDPQAAFVSKFSSDGAFVDTLRFGGRNELGANAVAVAADGLVHVVGSTSSTNFPTTPTAFQPEYGSGQSDAFVARVSFHEPPATVNLALNKPIYASSSFGAAFTPDRAVDGSGATRWSSEFSDPQWIFVDLGGPFSITRVVLRWEAAYSSEYQLLVSDDAQNWRTLLTRNKSSADVDDLEVAAVARYIGIYSSQRGTPWGVSLFEFEVYGTTAALRNLALNAVTAASSSWSSAFTPNFAVDGDLQTRWSSEFSDPQWIAIDLGSGQQMNRVVLRWEDAYSAEYQLLVSDDALTWRTVLTKTKAAKDVDDFSISEMARYVGIYSTQRGTPWGVSLFEFEVYGP